MVEHHLILIRPLVSSMTLGETVTILVCLSAGFSYLNHRYIRLPVTIGLLAIALGMSLVLVLLGKLGIGIDAEAESLSAVSISTRRSCMAC